MQSWREQTQTNAVANSENRAPHQVDGRARSIDADLRRRQALSIQQAREKRELIVHKKSEVKRREEKQLKLAKEAELKVVGSNVESKIMEPTKASESHRLRPDVLDSNEIKRKTEGAHERSVAYGGYDLKYSGRAVPAWRMGIG